MSVDVAMTAFGVGAVFSLASSWVLVSRLERVGERLGLSEALLGVIAALAADAPEITASVTALTHHQRSVSAGVVLGSNAFNLATLLGLGAIVAGSIGLHRKVVALGGLVAIWTALVCVLTVLGPVSALVGMILILVILVPNLFVLSGVGARLLQSARPRRIAAWLALAVNEEELELSVAIRPPRGQPRDAWAAVAALVAVVVGCIAMERGASTVGTHFGVAPLVVGGLVLAGVTSLPNAVGAIYLAKKARGAAALSTALNSNTFNVLAGLLIPATALGVAGRSGPETLVVLAYVVLTVVTLILAYGGRGLRRWSGSLILVCYVGFVVWLVLIT